jgi:hypothetical protein
MSTNFLEVLCDQKGFGGDGEYYGGNDTQLGRINVFSTRPRVHFDLELSLIDAVRASPLG